MSFEDELRRIADALAAERAAAGIDAGATAHAIERAVTARLDEAEARARELGRAEGYDRALSALERERDRSFVEGREAGITKGREIGRAEGREAGLAEGWEAGRAGGRAADTAVSSQPDRQEREAVALGRLARALRLLDRAGSLTEILDGLTAAAGQTAARVGVLLVDGQRSEPLGSRERNLSGWRFVGFDRQTDELQDARRFRLPLADAGFLADAVAANVRDAGVEAESEAGRDAVVHDAKDIDGTTENDRLPAFARARGESSARAHRAVAIPLTLGGAVVGVLYGDEPSESRSDGSWAAMLEILARHASGRLEAITALRVAHLEEQRLAIGNPKSDAEVRN